MAKRKLKAFNCLTLEEISIDAVESQLVPRKEITKTRKRVKYEEDEVVSADNIDRRTVTSLLSKKVNLDSNAQFWFID